MNRWAALICFLALCFAVAALGGVATARTVHTWFQQLHKPSFNPPPWLFGPVWTLLYIAMAVAAWRVWEREGLRWPMGLFAAQLFLNGLWSWVFFAWKMPGAACIDIAALWAAILATLIAFWRVDAVAGALFVPYLLWVSFAAVLNATLYWLNR